MFNAISWQGYWTFLAILSTAYYLLIGLLYYRQEIFNKLSPQRHSASETIPPHFFREGDTVHRPTLFQAEGDHGAPLAQSEEPAVFACMDELEAFFVEAKSRKWNRPELLDSLRQLLSKYPSLQTSAYRTSLENLIQTHCEHHCSIHLKAADRMDLW